MFTFDCDFCSFTSDYKCNLIRHMRTVHSERNIPRSYKSFRCPLCSDVKSRSKDLLDHYKTFHGLDFDEICYEFDDEQQFKEWKRKVEDRDKTFYISDGGNSRSGGKTKKTLRCHRNGFYKNSGKHVRKSKASYKINGFCPSCMKTVTDEATGSVTVYFISLHVGHTNEIERLPFNKADELVLAQKLVAGVGTSLADPIDDVDSDNVNEMVEKIVSSNNMVRLFKPRGKLVADLAAVGVNDFLLVISTDHQLSLLKKHGTNIVAMNGTHGLNPTSVELTTILAIGDNRVFPCAFLLSNRSDVEVMTLFVQAVRDAIGHDVHVSTFMTDVAGVFYDSWSNVMPAPKNRLFSTFLVEQGWKKNLLRIQDRAKKEYTFKCLRKLLDEPNEEAFFQLLPSTVAHMQADPGTSEFGDYFASQFSNNYRLWAYCFRESGCPTIDKNLKSTCKMLKLVCCLKSKRTIRLEKAVPSLLDFVTNEAFKSSPKNADLLILSAIQQRHESSLSIPMQHVTESGEGWIVKARDSPDDFYFVELTTDECECRMRCENCRCCLHSYQCTCFDSCVESNMCEHIHRVAFLRSQNSRTVDEANLPVSPTGLRDDSMETDSLPCDDSSPEESDSEHDPPVIAKFVNEDDPDDVDAIRENEPAVIVQFIDEDSSDVVRLVQSNDPSSKIELIAEDEIQTVGLMAEDPSASVRLMPENPPKTDDALFEELSAYVRKPDQSLRERVSNMWTEIRNELKFTSDYEVLERALKPILPAMKAARQHQSDIL